MNLHKAYQNKWQTKVSEGQEASFLEEKYLLAKSFPKGKKEVLERS